MFSFQPKSTRHKKKSHSVKEIKINTNTTSRNFKISMISMLKALVEKVGQKPEQMRHFSQEMETVQENQTEMPQVKDTIRDED